ncbi:MAG: hypothetical protein NC408_09010 [Candidatus Gastranaerophilales bacterium]|nr:hypothetical protein [Candidatus Gastranaerophilales bacterium]MCM1072448.1 hypothetical protein [Bacteroides sp.]
MINKKIALGVSLGILFAAALGCFLLSEKDEVEQTESAVEEKTVPKVQVKQSVSQPAKYVPPVKKADLYNSLDKNLPFSAIADLSVLSESARKTINNLLDESCGGIYFLKHNNEKAILVVDLTPDGEENAIKRHDFNFVEISLHDGTVLNNLSEEKDSKYDKWKFDGDLPLSHTHYNDAKELIYTEVWNYSEEEPIKYKKTDKDGNVISLRKEAVENDVNLREEHIFYDNEGNMTKNVSFNYDGTDLTRFTYYNSQTPDDSAMLVSEYEDGIKKKEILYSSDYKVKNVYLPEYKDGQKSELKILDKDNKIIETIQPF